LIRVAWLSEVVGPSLTQILRTLDTGHKKSHHPIEYFNNRDKTIIFNECIYDQQ
jgi:hypothetical protein